MSYAYSDLTTFKDWYTFADYRSPNIQVAEELDGKFGLAIDGNLFTEIAGSEPNTSVFSLNETSVILDEQLTKSYELTENQSWLLVRDLEANMETALALAINVYAELRKGNIAGLTAIRDGLLNNKRKDSEGRIFFTILTEKI